MVTCLKTCVSLKHFLSVCGMACNLSWSNGCRNYKVKKCEARKGNEDRQKRERDRLGKKQKLQDSGIICITHVVQS